MNTLGFFNPFAKMQADLIYQLPFFQAKIETITRRVQASAVAMNDLNNRGFSPPSSVLNRFQALLRTTEKATDASVKAETLWRKHIQTAIAKGAIKREQLPSGLGALPVVAIVVVIAVLGVIGAIAAAVMYQNAKTAEQWSKSQEIAWNAYYDAYSAWINTIQTQTGVQVPPPAQPEFVQNPPSQAGNTVGDIAALMPWLLVLGVAGWFLTRRNRT